MAGRELPPTSRFAADDGAADPALAAAAAAYAAGTGSLADVVAALALARVLVPVVAVEEPGDPEGPAQAGPFAEARHATAGVVAVAAPDGRTALPVFSSVAALEAWRADARPMPAEGPRAAAAALSEGWDLLALDPPEALVVPRPAVRALASGAAWVPAVRDGAVDARVRDAVVRATAGVPGVLAADAVPGRRAEVAVVLTLRAGLSREGLDDVLRAVGTRLAGAVADAVDSLELRVSAGDGGPRA